MKNMLNFKDFSAEELKAILDLAADIDIVQKSGAWYAYKGEKIGQGRENAKITLQNNPEMLAEIEEAVRKNYLDVDENSEEVSGNEDAVDTESK